MLLGLFEIPTQKTFVTYCKKKTYIDVFGEKYGNECDNMKRADMIYRLSTKKEKAK